MIGHLDLEYSWRTTVLNFLMHYVSRFVIAAISYDWNLLDIYFGWAQ